MTRQQAEVLDAVPVGRDVQPLCDLFSVRFGPDLHGTGLAGPSRGVDTAILTLFTKAILDDGTDEDSVRILRVRKGGFQSLVEDVLPECRNRDKDRSVLADVEYGPAAVRFVKRREVFGDGTVKVCQRHLSVPAGFRPPPVPTTKVRHEPLQQRDNAGHCWPSRKKVADAGVGVRDGHARRQRRQDRNVRQQVHREAARGAARSRIFIVTVGVGVPTSIALAAQRGFVHLQSAVNKDVDPQKEQDVGHNGDREPRRRHAAAVAVSPAAEDRVVTAHLGSCCSC